MTKSGAGASIALFCLARLNKDASSLNKDASRIKTLAPRIKTLAIIKTLELPGFLNKDATNKDANSRNYCCLLLLHIILKNHNLLLVVYFHNFTRKLHVELNVHVETAGPSPLMAAAAAARCE